jgi:hypothetical protein
MDSIDYFVMFVTDRDKFHQLQAESLTRFEQQTQHYVTNKIAQRRPQVSLLDK